MKNLVKILTTVIVAVFGCTSLSFGQALSSAQANAHATIVTPISIIKVSDMEFGNIAVGALAGSIDLAASATGTRIPYGGVTLPAVTGTVNAAAFTVCGQPNYAYGITLPTSVTIINGANMMAINSIVSLPAIAGTLSSTGTGSLYVGGVLDVSASQAAGTYGTAATFPVTVVYN